MLKIIKRDGRIQDFNLDKIKKSINRAALQCNTELNEDEMQNIFNECIIILKGKAMVTVENIQDAIEKALYKCGYRKIREAYKDYRAERTTIRETKSNIMQTIKKMGINTDKDNANVGNNFSAKLLRIASESNKWQVLSNMPKKLAKLYEQNDLYYHDLDSFNLSVNCLHIPLGKVLDKSFNPGYGTINKPKRITSAAELACILLQSCQNDAFGGQSFPNFDNDLAEYVELSRNEIKEELKLTASVFNIKYNIETLNLLAETKVEKEVRQAMQSIIYNLNSMASRAGQVGRL